MTRPDSKEHFVCATYRKVKGGCSAHQIRNVVVERLLLGHIKKLIAFIIEDEERFTQLVLKQSKRESDTGDGLNVQVHYLFSF